jgi:hypothetical protein
VSDLGPATLRRWCCAGLWSGRWCCLGASRRRRSCSAGGNFRFPGSALGQVLEIAHQQDKQRNEMGKCKLRIRRLTLATRAGSEEPDEDDDKADDDERLLAGEYMHQALEISVASSSSRVVRPHIHGVEDRIGGRFWAMPSDSEEVDQLACSMNMLSINSPLSQTSGKSLSSPETSGAYHKKGAVSPVVAQADGGSTGGRVTGVMSSKAAKAASKKVIRPWEGPLPPPRMSPKLSFGDILEKAKVRTMSSSILTDGCSMSSEFRRSPETRYPMHARSESQGSKEKLARQVEFEITNSNSTQVPHASAGQGSKATFVRHVEFEIPNSNSTQMPHTGEGFTASSMQEIEITKTQSMQHMGQAQNQLPYRACTTIQLYPNVPYRPIPGLVALFARSGTWTANPRAPHTRPQSAAASSYASVAETPTERANANGGTNRASINQGQGAGQGSMAGRREF